MRTTPMKRLAIVLAATVFFQEFRRVGEASNPGPYLYGGATSSATDSNAVGVASEKAVPLATAAHRRGLDDLEGDQWEEEIEVSRSSLNDPDGGVWEQEPIEMFGFGDAPGMPCEVEAEGLHMDADGVVGDLEWEPPGPCANSGYSHIISLPQDHPEAPWNQQDFIEEHAEPWDDLKWNLYMNQLEDVPSQVAFQEARERARLWEEFQKPKATPVAISSEKSSANSQPTVVHNGAIMLNEVWKPKPENSQRKTAKWRNAQRRRLRAADEEADEVPCVVGSSEREAATASPTVSASMETGDGRPRRSKEYRPRGRRSRAEAILVTANTTGSCSAYELLSTLQGRSHEIVAVALQEHWCMQGDLPDLQAKALKLGWKTAPVAATLSERGRGPSAGVAVAVPHHIGLAKLPEQEWDGSPAKSAGRIAKAWVQAVTPCGLLVITVYLWSSEGLTHRNRELVTTALGEGKAYGGPWIILGDFNVMPDELQQGLGQIIDRAGGTIWAPNMPTFYPSTQNQPRTIDFAILDTRIAGSRLSANVSIEGQIQGHRVVEFKVKGRTHNPLFWTLAAPRKLPRAPKCGCGRRPVIPSPANRGTTLDDLFKSTLQCMEAEICRRNDLVDSEGKPIAAFLGRGNGVAFVQRRALPPRNAAEVGEVSCPAQAMRWIAARATEMFHLGKIAAQGRPLSVPQLKQAHNIVQRFRKRFSSPKGRMDLGRAQGSWDILLDQSIGYTIGDEPQFWYDMAVSANQLAQELGHQAAQVRRRAWRLWVAQSVAKGAGACHAYVGRKLATADATVGPANRLDASPQAVVDHDLVSWKAIWERHKDTAVAPWRSHRVECQDIELPKVTAQSLRRAARSFKDSTAIGVDGIPPKVVATLSDELLHVVAELVNRVEEVGAWPQSYATAVLHLIPKPSGGRRPIGLLPTLVRLWERARRDAVRIWRSREGMPFSWAGKGKGSESAVWQQSVRAEAAVHRGHITAAMMVDLVKAFESVPLWRVWEAGLRRGLPACLLRLALEACSFSRRLVYNGAFSAAVDSLSAILAGGGLAVDLLALAMEEIVDEASRLCPLVVPYLVVDDLTLIACGPERTAVTQVVRAGRYCIERFESNGMIVSKNKAWENEGEGKSIALASTPAARRRLSTSTRAMGIPVRRRAKNLGVDYGPGSKIGKRIVMLSRWAKAKEKAGRVQKLGRTGAPRVFSTGLLASVRYGASLTGVTNSLLNEVRSLAAFTYGKLGGRSTTGRLALRKADPAIPLLGAPVKAWLTAVWNRSLDSDTLQCALTAAQAGLLKGNNPHTAVQGGAGAYVAALVRVGWKAPAVDVIVGHMGNFLRLGQGCDVRMLLRLFEERVTQVLLNQSSVAEELCDRARHNGYGSQHCLQDGANPIHDGKQLKGRPWMQPVLMAISIAKSEGAPTAVLESLRSMAEGGWWPQARLCSQGYTDNPLCQVCHSSEGTCLHRLTALHNPELVPKENEVELLKYVAQHSEDPLYFRGVPAWPAEVEMLEEDVQVLCRRESTGPFLATGDVYTDGALTGLFRAIKRAVWAVAVLREDMSVDWAVYGICGELDPSILRAELRAVLEALRMGLPPLTIHTDNAEVVEGFLIGEEMACQAHREGADLWRLVWQKLQEMGEGVEIRKVKAHTTESDVLEGLIDLKHQAGNAAADALAVHARRVAEARVPTAAFRSVCLRTCKWYLWCSRVIAHWITDTNADGREEDGEVRVVGNDRRQRTREESARRGGTVSHRLWLTGGGSVMCQRCGLTRPSAALDKFRRQPCAGCPSGRILARLHENAALMHQVLSFSDHDMTLRGAKPIASEGSKGITGSCVEPPLHGVEKGLEARQPQYSWDEQMEDEDPFGHLSAGLDNNDPPSPPHTGVQACGPDQSAGLHSTSSSSGTRGHLIRKHGSTAWCDVCGRWAISRVGRGLTGECSGTLGSYAIRRERLREGKHPLTGRPL